MFRRLAMTYLLLSALPLGAVPSFPSSAIVDRARAALGKPDARVRLELLNTPSVPQALTAGDQGWRWYEEVLCPADGLTPRVRIETRGPEGQRFNWTLAFKKVVLRDSLALRADLRRGAEIGPADVTSVSEWTDASRLQVGYVERLPAGRWRLRRDLTSQTRVRTQDLEEVPEHDEGEQVNLTSREEGLTLVIPAVVQEPAYAGRPFRVRTHQGKIRTAWVWPNGAVGDQPPTKGASNR